ncbi:MAG: phospho-N-acetylmuramoyl-pentapeptide-transferase [Candidatus Omnitrophica bacterium]|nr:phospho-N-acetylmuramoyl-pentapeptide-transferase [Candidatus Omnitrophota bacterium]
MLYHLLYPLREIFFGFNIFRYITFRAAMAALTSFFIVLICAPWVVRKLKKLGIGENVRKEESKHLYSLHKGKEGTPTMGGILILIAVLFSSFLWADICNRYVLISIFVLLWLGITGFTDDYLKQLNGKSKGMLARTKLISQIVLGLGVGIFLFLSPQNPAQISLPLLKNICLKLGIFYILWVTLVICASSNAVNLTDGLDGLAIGIIIMVALAFSVLSYVSGHIKFSQYLFIPYIAQSGELAVFCASIAGAGLGFLWFNCFPASIFMGDVGALPLGGALGVVSLLIRKELFLVVAGGIFVVEALSVILQVASFRLRKKRIFKIAPFHHHLQFLGWAESKVIVRLWIVAVLLAILTIVMLKIR